MKLLGNLIWLVFGGILISIEYLISSMLLMVTIIGIPFGIQTLKLAIVALWPFGTEIRLKPGNSGCLSSIMNLVWIFIGGFWICLTHIFFGVLFALTIIGIPFAKQHFKLAGLALTPFGKEIV
jgi:uncharacterized membrane protein YccF (DUF307 family)